VRRFQSGPVGVVDALVILLAGLQEVVELIAELGFAEREVTHYDGKQDYSQGKYVRLPSIVFFGFADFWCHITLRPPESIKLINIPIRCEAEVGQLQVHALVQQDVLEFDVAVDDVFGVHVFKLLDQLICKIEANVLAHAAIFLADIEKEWALNVLHDNIDLVMNHLVIAADNAIVAILVHLDDALVRHLAEDVDFFTDIVNCVLHLHILRRHYLDGELEGRLVDVAGQPDLAG